MNKKAKKLEVEEAEGEMQFLSDKCLDLSSRFYNEWISIGLVIIICSSLRKRKLSPRFFLFLSGIAIHNDIKIYKQEEGSWWNDGEKLLKKMKEKEMIG